MQTSEGTRALLKRHRAVAGKAEATGRRRTAGRVQHLIRRPEKKPDLRIMSLL